jgi:cytochrome c oxidase assembly protein subunit 15
LRRPLIPKLAILFVLGGLQGLLGWYMVKSGLVDDPHVSQYRLTAHLGLAVLIYAWMLHIALTLWYGSRNIPQVSAGLKRAVIAIMALVFVTILSGGFVAGLKAGHAYNTFPLMDGHWIPEVMFMLDPWWLNFFENIATVQFDHRLLAMTVILSVALLWLASLRHRLHGQLRAGLHVLMATVTLQVILGISTLLMHVPVPLAATHQAGALLVLTAVLFVNQRMVRMEGGRQ